MRNGEDLVPGNLDVISGWFINRGFINRTLLHYVNMKKHVQLRSIRKLKQTRL